MFATCIENRKMTSGTEKLHLSIVYALPLEIFVSIVEITHYLLASLDIIVGVLEPLQVFLDVFFLFPDFVF